MRDAAWVWVWVCDPSSSLRRLQCEQSEKKSYLNPGFEFRTSKSWLPKVRKVLGSCTRIADESIEEKSDVPKNNAMGLMIVLVTD